MVRYSLRSGRRSSAYTSEKFRCIVGCVLIVGGILLLVLHPGRPQNAEAAAAAHPRVTTLTRVDQNNTTLTPGTATTANSPSTSTTPIDSAESPASAVPQPLDISLNTTALTFAAGSDWSAPIIATSTDGSKLTWTVDSDGKFTVNNYPFSPTAQYTFSIETLNNDLPAGVYTVSLNGYDQAAQRSASKTITINLLARGTFDIIVDPTTTTFSGTGVYIPFSILRHNGLDTPITVDTVIVSPQGQSPDYIAIQAAGMLDADKGYVSLARQGTTYPKQVVVTIQASSGKFSTSTSFPLSIP